MPSPYTTIKASNILVLSSINDFLKRNPRNKIVQVMLQFAKLESLEDSSEDLRNAINKNRGGQLYPLTLVLSGDFGYVKLLLPPDIASQYKDALNQKIGETIFIGLTQMMNVKGNIQLYPDFGFCIQF